MTFVTVVFVVVVVVISIERWKCTHALSLPDDPERSAAFLDDSAKFLAYQSLQLVAHQWQKSIIKMGNDG